MSLLSFFGFAPRESLLYPTSPWSEGALQSIVWSDIYGSDFVAPMTRAEAMSLPSVFKARNLVVPTLAACPIAAMNRDGLLPDDDQPTWTYRTNGLVTPYMRMVKTLDDLIFYGHALWKVTRGSEGQILDAEHVPQEWWKITPEGGITINDAPVTSREVLYFPSHVEGLLDRAGSTFRAARNVEKAVERRAQSPIPLVEIHHVDPDTPLNETEAKALVDKYNKARLDPNGATVFTPPHIKIEVFGDKADSGAMVEARNAVRLDVANFFGIPAALLDGSTSTASLTYSTQEGHRNEFVDYALTPWIETVQSRLSLDDVVPRGQRVRFDLTQLLTTAPAATGADVQD